MAEYVAPVTFVLASESPRRLQLLADLGITPVVRPPAVDESRLDGETPARMVERLSRVKAASVPVAEGEVVIAADTIAAYRDRVLGKPVDRDDAIATLEFLSGTTHQVLTGVCVRTTTSEVSAVEATDVEFRSLNHDEIVAYVATGEAMGKAGAYAIQETGDSFVAAVRGSWSNVVGLPLASTTRLLGKVGVSPPIQPKE